MTADPVILFFKEQYDRFADMIDKQIAVCPDNLWIRKSGGFFFWQQILHTLVIAERYILTEDRPSLQQRFSIEEVLLLKEPEGYMSREETAELSRKVREQAHAFMDGLTVDDLQKPHERLSRIWNRPATYQAGLTALLTHAVYHIGCCDALLRENGIAGVY